MFFLKFAAFEMSILSIFALMIAAVVGVSKFAGTSSIEKSLVIDLAELFHEFTSKDSEKIPAAVEDVVLIPLDSWSFPRFVLL